MEHVRLFTSTLDVSQDGGGTVIPCIHLKHRNTLHGMYIPTEIHSQLKSYSVSGCYVSKSCELF